VFRSAAGTGNDTRQGLVPASTTRSTGQLWCRPVWNQHLDGCSFATRSRPANTYRFRTDSSERGPILLPTFSLLSSNCRITNARHSRTLQRLPAYIHASRSKRAMAVACPGIMISSPRNTISSVGPTVNVSLSAFSLSVIMGRGEKSSSEGGVPGAPWACHATDPLSLLALTSYCVGWAPEGGRS
jgi:hypothetical protein